MLCPVEIKVIITIMWMECFLSLQFTENRDPFQEILLQLDVLKCTDNCIGFNKIVFKVKYLKLIPPLHYPKNPKVFFFIFTKTSATN